MVKLTLAIVLGVLLPAIFAEVPDLLFLAQYGLRFRLDFGPDKCILVQGFTFALSFGETAQESDLQIQVRLLIGSRARLENVVI